MHEVSLSTLLVFLAILTFILDEFASKRRVSKRQNVSLVFLQYLIKYLASQERFRFVLKIATEQGNWL